MKAKFPRNETTTALVCSLDFIPLAPENSFNKAKVSYPREKSGRKGASLNRKWICPGSKRVNIKEGWGMCPICRCPGPEAGLYVRTHTRFSCECCLCASRKPCTQAVARL